MITTTVRNHPPVTANYLEAAERLNEVLDHPNPPVTHHMLMTFALGLHDADDLCAKFELALRAVRGIPPTDLPNPVLH